MTQVPAESPASARTPGFSVRRTFNVALDRAEPLIEVVIRLCGWSAILFVTAIFVFVAVEGVPALHELSLTEFFTSPNWRPTSQVREQYGILALICGTLSVTLLAMLLAVPFGLGA